MENFAAVRGSKALMYDHSIKQIAALVSNEKDRIANMANTAAVLMTQFGHHWIGFYRVNEGVELVLGPFQGPLACTRIGFGKGVCGTSWKEKRTIIVADVHSFPGHIACSSLSNSEIVVPVIVNGSVYAVLDLDSTDYNAFDEEDREGLEQIASILGSSLE